MLLANGIKSPAATSSGDTLRLQVRTLASHTSSMTVETPSPGLLLIVVDSGRQ